MIYKNWRRRRATGHVARQTVLFIPVRHTTMDTPQPPQVNGIPQPSNENTPIPGPDTMRELGHDPGMDRLQTWFLLRSQLKHVQELAKEMNNPDQNMHALSGMMARAAGRLLSTAQLFELLNAQR